MRFLFLSVFSTLILFTACNDDEPAVDDITALSVSVDGNTVADGPISVGQSPEITIVFDGPLSLSYFEESVEVETEAESPTVNYSYSNSNSRVIIEPTLSMNTKYKFSISSGEIGAQGQVLSSSISFELVTTTSTAPSACTSASNPCLRSLTIEDDLSSNTISYYSNYDIQSVADFSSIRNAIVVVHGANRNNDDYFSWMSKTLEDVSLTNSTLLIAPQFKSSVETNSETDLYWDSNNWRDGSEAVNGMSSFAVLDSIISRIDQKMSSLEKLIITGHSSGGLFTHVYGASNQMESRVPEISIKYLVANSQYFYYPGEERVNESNQEFFIPTNCSGYNFWPLGYNLVPPYVNTIGQLNVDDQLITRNIHYLLGNGNQSDPSLNTSDCGPVLLGSSRYKRGENIYYYMQEKYPDNKHQRTLVPGIGHNGQAMYQSEQFKDLIRSVF